MLIASKFEEVYAPGIADFVYITDNAYSKEQIFNMEHSIISTLDFSIHVPSSYRFLERFAKVADASPKIFNLSRYLIELSLIE